MRFAALMRHRWRIVVHKRRNWIWLIIAPIITFLLTMHFLEISVDSGAVPVVIVDEDDSEYSHIIAERLAEKSWVKIVHADREHAERMVETRRAETVVLFPEGFMEQVVAGEYENLLEVKVTPMSASIGLLQEVVASEVARLAVNVAAADYVQQHMPDVSEAELDSLWQEAWLHTDRQWTVLPLLTIEYTPWYGGDVLDEGASDTWRRAFTVLLVFVMFSIFQLNQWIVEEKNNGMFKRIHFTGTSAAKYVSGNLAAVATIVCVQLIPMLVYLALAEQWSWKMVAGSSGLFCLFLIVTVFLSAFTAFVCGNATQYHVTSLLIVGVSTILSGQLLPLEQLTAKFALMSQLFPQYWVFYGMYNELYQAIAVLSAMGILFALLTWRKGVRK